MSDNLNKLIIKRFHKIPIIVLAFTIILTLYSPVAAQQDYNPQYGPQTINLPTGSVCLNLPQGYIFLDKENSIGQYREKPSASRSQRG